MTTTTQEPKTKSSRKRKAAQSEDPPAAETTVAADAGGPVSTDSETDIDRLHARLKSFGFEVPIALIGQWSGATFTQIELTASRWQNEYDRANAHEAIPEADRTPIPSVLASQESVTPDLQKLAQDAAFVSAALGHTADFNLYPPSSELAKIWLTALGESKASPDGPANGAAKPVSPVPSPSPAKPTADELRIANEKRQADAKADRERQQELAIKAAQHDMEEATKHAADLEDEILDMKAELGELNAAFKNASSRARKASRVLEKARAGVFERTLPFPKESKRDASLEVPDQDVDGNPEGPTVRAAPPAPKVDEGAFVSLDHMIKTDLQEFIPGTPEDKGISAKQCEALKKIVGETIGDLEKWQKNNGGGEWWRKAIKDKGVGLGGAACDKLVEAHEAIRRKFPIPSPDDVSDDVKQAEPNTPTYVIPTAEEAAERISKLCKRAESLSTTCENESGIKFLLDVATEANKRRDTILETGTVTEAQASAIVGWETGIEKWAGDTAAETVSDAVDDEEVDFGDGLSEDSDDLDVPESEDDDEEDDDA